MTPQELVGERTERHFLDLAGQTAWKTPYWYLGVEQADAATDAQGVDVVAWVLSSDERDWVPVPIQVKSSEEEVLRFKKLHADIDYVGVVIALSGSEDDEAFLERYYAALRAVRDDVKRLRRAERLVLRLLRHPLQGGIAFWEREIALRRRQYAQVAT